MNGFLFSYWNCVLWFFLRKRAIWKWDKKNFNESYGIFNVNKKFSVLQLSNISAWQLYIYKLLQVQDWLNLSLRCLLNLVRILKILKLKILKLFSTKSYRYLKRQNMLFKYHGFNFLIMINRLEHVFKVKSFISDELIQEDFCCTYKYFNL